MAAQSINIKAADTTAGASGTSNLTINGGLLSAAAVNLTALNGTIAVDVDQINGPVNLTGANAGIHTQKGNLFINTSNVDGDPTFSNVSDNVTLSASDLSPTGGAEFVALSGKDVVFLGTTGTIDTTSAGGVGGDITIGAGVTFDAGVI